MTMAVDHFVFIIHPALYESMPQTTSALSLFADWECEVKQRSLEAIAQLDAAGTFVVQLEGGSTVLLDAARKRLGDARVLHVTDSVEGNAPLRCRPSSTLSAEEVAAWPGSRQAQQDGLRKSYGDQCQLIRDHLAAHALTFDPNTTTSECWGESFEGCVPGYGSAYAHGLGLGLQRLRVAFDKCVCDATFMYRARQL